LGEVTGGTSGELSESVLFEVLVEIDVKAVEFGIKRKVSFDREPRIETRVGHHDSHVVGPIFALSRVTTGNLNFAGTRLEQPRCQEKSGGFSGSVNTQEGDDFPGLHRPSEALQDRSVRIVKENRGEFKELHSREPT
jgi:hypothetical protein